MNLWQYIQGNCKGKEAHEIEKEAMKDPFLADALAGYEALQGNPQKAIAALQKEIRKREKRTAGKTFGKKGKTLRGWGIAISLLLIAMAAAWYFLQDLPYGKPETVQVVAMEEQTGIMPEQQELVVAKEDTIVVEEKVRTDTIKSPKPQPVVGMVGYQGYISRNLIHPDDEECRNVKGAVVVTFKVGQSGRPYNIQVAEGLCNSINKEAIRLVINGPNWRKGLETDEVVLTINF